MRVSTDKNEENREHRGIKMVKKLRLSFICVSCGNSPGAYVLYGRSSTCIRFLCRVKVSESM